MLSIVVPKAMTSRLEGKVTPSVDDELEKLWNQRVITKDIALAYATNPTNLALRFTDEPEAAEGDGESMMSMLEP